MGRRKGRNNKPAALLRPVTHNKNCICDRCLDADAKAFEEHLDKAWEEHNKEAQQEGMTTQMANIRLVVRESPVMGTYHGEDMGDAAYVTCPMAICGNIYAVGKRRK